MKTLNIKLKMVFLCACVAALCYGCVRADYPAYKAKYPNTEVWHYIWDRL
jgi:hypothetical protein